MLCWNPGSSISCAWSLFPCIRRGSREVVSAGPRRPAPRRCAEMSELNWDDLKILIALERRGSMLAAAAALGVDHSTISRRLGGLETAVGVDLVDRSP
ncbi:MAG: LysR family transcriptional regulator, partial [Devosia sp.]